MDMKKLLLSLFVPTLFFVATTIKIHAEEPQIYVSSCEDNNVTDLSMFTCNGVSGTWTPAGVFCKGNQTVDTNYCSGQVGGNPKCSFVDNGETIYDTTCCIPCIDEDDTGPTIISHGNPCTAGSTTAVCEEGTTCHNGKCLYDNSLNQGDQCLDTFECKAYTGGTQYALTCNGSGFCDAVYCATDSVCLTQIGSNYHCDIPSGRCEYGAPTGDDGGGDDTGGYGENEYGFNSMGAASALLETVNQAPAFTTPRTLIGDVITRALPLVIGFGGLILLVMIVMGGYLMLTNPQNPEAQVKGRTRVVWSVAGFLMLFASYWIFQIIETMFGLSVTR